MKRETKKVRRYSDFVCAFCEIMFSVTCHVFVDFIIYIKHSFHYPWTHVVESIISRKVGQCAFCNGPTYLGESQDCVILLMDLNMRQKHRPIIPLHNMLGMGLKDII